MPEVIWHMRENQFDSVTRYRRKRMNSILTDSWAKISNGALAEAGIVPIKAELLLPKTNWDAAYAGWKGARAAWHGRTKAVDNLFEALQVSPGAGGRSKVAKWRSRVGNFWGDEHEIPSTLFPRGNEAFTDGGRDEIITEIKGLGDRLHTVSLELTEAAAVPGLPAEEAEELTEQAEAMEALSVEVLAFHTQIKAARDRQTEKEGLVDQAAALCEQRRKESAKALLLATYMLGAHLLKQDRLAELDGFFDLTLIISPPAGEEDEEEEPDEEPVVPGVPQNVTITPGEPSSGQVIVNAEVDEGTTFLRLILNPGQEQSTVGTFTSLPITVSFSPGQTLTLALTAGNEAGESAPSEAVTGNAG